jgi:hemerythrin superfamily protein
MPGNGSSDKADVFDLIKKDHREVEQLYEQWKSARSFEKRKDIIGQISNELSKHAAAEEVVLYPVTRHTVQSGGDYLADHSLGEHQQIKETLDRLLNNTTEQEMASSVPRLMDIVQKHVHEEENDMIPKMRANLSVQIKSLTAAFRTIKAMGPTHPHPGMPNRPPMNLMAGSLLGVLDRITDFVKRLPK